MIQAFVPHKGFALALQEHNSNSGHTHKLAVNRFADWHKEEFLATILPNHGQPKPSISSEGKQPLRHENRVPEHMLPSTVDWRGTGADSPVKDQASCGSCWVSLDCVLLWLLLGKC